MQSKASAIWKGSLKEGKGTFSATSNVFNDVPYTFATRFAGAAGTNPEELIAAAHASCFAMAVSAELGGRGITPESLESSATVTLEQTAAGFSVTASHLDLVAKAPGADRAKVEEAINAAKAGCPISKLLNAKITLDFRLA
jgi:osmotically inducible protein OsmC